MLKISHHLPLCLGGDEARYESGVCPSLPHHRSVPLHRDVTQGPLVILPCAQFSREAMLTTHRRSSAESLVAKVCSLSLCFFVMADFLCVALLAEGLNVILLTLS